MSILELVVSMVLISILAVLGAVGITFIIYTLFWGDIQRKGEHHDQK